MPASAAAEWSPTSLPTRAMGVTSTPMPTMTAIPLLDPAHHAIQAQPPRTVVGGRRGIADRNDGSQLPRRLHLEELVQLLAREEGSRHPAGRQSERLGRQLEV